MTIEPDKWKKARITDIIGPPNLSMVKPIPIHRKVFT